MGGGRSPQPPLPFEAATGVPGVKPEIRLGYWEFVSVRDYRKWKLSAMSPSRSCSWGDLSNSSFLRGINPFNPSPAKTARSFHDVSLPLVGTPGYNLSAEDSTPPPSAFQQFPLFLCLRYTLRPIVLPLPDVCRLPLWLIIDRVTQNHWCTSAVKNMDEMNER